MIHPLRYHLVVGIISFTNALSRPVFETFLGKQNTLGVVFFSDTVWQPHMVNLHLQMKLAIWITFDLDVNHCRGTQQPEFQV